MVQAKQGPCQSLGLFGDWDLVLRYLGHSLVSRETNTMLKLAFVETASRHKWLEEMLQRCKDGREKASPKDRSTSAQGPTPARRHRASPKTPTRPWGPAGLGVGCGVKRDGVSRQNQNQKAPRAFPVTAEEAGKLEFYNQELQSDS